jgi:oxygen-independent coproporphyrinogen-3 oxidase
MDEDDVLRAEIIQRLMCNGEIDIVAVEQRFEIGFRDYFSDAWCELERLANDGLIVIEDRRIAATSQGRYLLRIIAMCFDRYLQRQRTSDGAARFSKVI